MSRAYDLIGRLQAEIVKRDARIAELEAFKTAYNEWHDKTEWVQAEVSAGVIGFRALGRHRADVMTGLVDELRLELAALKAQQPSAGVVLPEWLRDDESLAERLRIAGWEAVHDAQWSGLEVLRCDIWQAGRLNPCRAQAAPLPYWEPCNPGCDPEFNGQRSKDCAQLCHQARAAITAGCAVAVPDGYALVPQRMHLDASVIEAINYHCGDGQEDAGYGQHTDGLLWVGFTEDDDGVKSYGLNIATAEYPEEGSTQLVEFAAAPSAQQKESGDDAAAD